jgi:hypothetical protein
VELKWDEWLGIAVARNGSVSYPVSGNSDVEPSGFKSKEFAIFP